MRRDKPTPNQPVLYHDGHAWWIAEWCEPSDGGPGFWVNANHGDPMDGGSWTPLPKPEEA